ncbi:hypothetical protein E4T56_gene3645 [Termitomyces sp. T112]|nr:hypothetical protein E4T56_gene3645 [Termitomyces sp. T112]
MLNHSKCSPLLRKVRWFVMKEIIFRISSWYVKYCGFFKIELPFQETQSVYGMPFNTVLKCGERVREDEALSMKLARSLGLPVPRVLFYSDDEDAGGGIIWMTRVPGDLLSQVWRDLSDVERSSIMGELHQCFVRLRECKNPRSPKISSITGTWIRSFRADSGVIPVCLDKSELFRYLVRPRNHAIREQSEEKRVKFDDQTRKIEHLADMSHSIVFAHGDLMLHNIIVKDGHLSGIIDWECAGWLPEYWNYTTMTVRAYTSPRDWSFAIYNDPAFKYYEELICDHALYASTCESYPLFL